MDLDAWIGERAAVEATAELVIAEEIRDRAVEVDERDALDLGVAEQLTHGEPVATADRAEIAGSTFLTSRASFDPGHCARSSRRDSMLSACDCSIG